MYLFKCSNGHYSYSASRHTYGGDNCPRCGATVKLRTQGDLSLVRRTDATQATGKQKGGDA